MKIYCVRHGQAAEADDDAKRPLTDKGRTDVECVARFIGDAGVHIDHIMHSPKVRAVETAEIFAKFLKVDHVKECPTLLDENNDVSELLSMLPAWEGDTMLVGHLPFMCKLVSALIVGDPYHERIVNYPPGTVICLDRCDNQRWIISWLLGPQLLPSR